MSRSPIRYAIGECDLGALLVAASPQGVCAIILADDDGALLPELRRFFPDALLAKDDDAKLLSPVIALVKRPSSPPDFPMDIQGSAFQEQVWTALRAIPAGKTVTYRELAASIGRPEAVRAVAGACGANRLAIAIPCHRVIRSDGSLSGYRWGVERKRRLLESESEA